MLDENGRTLLSISYKAVIKQKIDSKTNLIKLEENESNLDKKKIIKEYINKIDNELKELYYELIKKIDNILLPSSTDTESKSFYLKIEADYYRYIAEISSGDEVEKLCQKSAQTYENAYNETIRELPPTHPLRLSILLNYSTFQYDFMKNPEMACETAKMVLLNKINRHMMTLLQN